MELKNKNFISPLMTKKDVMMAFNIMDATPLIEQGFIKRYYQYFKPTQKLWELITPDKIEIIDVGRINGFNHFWFNDIEKIFECDKYTAQLISKKFFEKSSYGYFKRTEALNQLLADGETILNLKGDTNE